MRLSQYIPAAVLLTCLASCNALSNLEERQYENLIAQGAIPQVTHEPEVAGALNLLPGFGDIYNGEWGAFAFDFLLWWPSVVWAVPQGIVTARNNNKKATIAYYTAGPGRSERLDPNRNESVASINR